LKRIDFIRHLTANGCVFFREGANHTVYINRPKKKVSTVPRHSEINEYTARKICKDLDIPAPQ